MDFTASQLKCSTYFVGMNIKQVILAINGLKSRVLIGRIFRCLVSSRSQQQLKCFCLMSRLGFGKFNYTTTVVGYGQMDGVKWWRIYEVELFCQVFISLLLIVSRWFLGDLVGTGLTDDNWHTDTNLILDRRCTSGPTYREAQCSLSSKLLRKYIKSTTKQRGRAGVETKY